MTKIRYTATKSKTHEAFATVKDETCGHHIASAIIDDAELIAHALNVYEVMQSYPETLNKALSYIASLR